MSHFLQKRGIITLQQLACTTPQQVSKLLTESTAVSTVRMDRAIKDAHQLISALRILNPLPIHILFLFYFIFIFLVSFSRLLPLTLPSSLLTILCCRFDPSQLSQSSTQVQRSHQSQTLWIRSQHSSHFLFRDVSEHCIVFLFCILSESKLFPNTYDIRLTPLLSNSKFVTYKYL